MSQDMIATVQGAAVAQLLRNMDPVAAAEREQGVRLINSVIEDNQARAKDVNAEAGAKLVTVIDTISAKIEAESAKPSPNAAVLAAYGALLERVRS